MTDPTDKIDTDLKRKAEAKPDHVSHVSHFAQIEREHGDALTDPKRRAMLKARSDGHAEAHAASGQSGEDKKS